MAQEIPISPACVEVRVRRGTDTVLDFVLTDGAGRAINITIDDVVFTLKDSIDGVVLDQQTSSAGAHYDAIGGRVVFELPRTLIDDEAEPECDTFWVYEVRRIVGGGAGPQHVHIQGEFIIQPAVGV